ncbi:MAG: HEAT repeat domain-containing protein [Pirellula sp.]|jgi:hypothetical protein|nr:HEAT repeat domain-containing protein [Pirellula sp.]
MSSFSVKPSRKVLPGRMSALVCISLMALATGCADGPFYHMKKLNPVIVQQWNEDKKRASLYEDRISEFDQLKSQIASYSPEEQDRYIGTLTQSSINDSSPEIRRRVAMVLEEVPNDRRSIDALVKLSQDKNEKVRMTVAKSLAKSTDEIATQTLITMASKDKSQAVKLLAIESLGGHKTDDVKTFLAQQLNDRSPAIQSSATTALKEQTGVDFRGDVAKWKQYMNGENVEPETPSLAEQFMSLWR